MEVIPFDQRYPHGTRLAPQVVRRYLNQLANALQSLHEKHIIHRDVKPANMFLTADNQVLLSDLGIAVVAPGSSYEQVDSVGTPAYMAPEQFAGKPC